ncbi:MAG: type II toxin-antitoxin system RelE/ParE family toxin [Candidatus Dormibacteria bacterium]
MTRSARRTRVILDEAFLRDRDSQVAWLLQERRAGDLRRVRARLREALRQLAEYPELGHDEDGDGLRELSLYPLPLVVLYQLEMAAPQVVRVLRLFHERQDQDVIG